MSEALIAKLIEKRVQAWAELQDLPVAMPDVKFDPPEETIYVRLDHLPAPTTSAFLEGAHKAFIGVYQLAVVCPRGNGAGVGRRVAMSFSDRFPVNLVLQEGAFKLQVTTPVSLGPLIDDTQNARTVHPCSFQYRADTVS